MGKVHWMCLRIMAQALRGAKVCFTLGSCPTAAPSHHVSPPCRTPGEGASYTSLHPCRSGASFFLNKTPSFRTVFLFHKITLGFLINVPHQQTKKASYRNYESYKQQHFLVFARVSRKLRATFIITTSKCRSLGRCSCSKCLYFKISNSFCLYIFFHWLF